MKTDLTSEEKKVYRDYYSGKNRSNLRYRWYADTFFKKVKNKRILEIGAGEGGVISQLNDKNIVIGSDISESGVDQCNKLGIKCILNDISSEKLPFNNGTFDYVIMLEVLEHVKSPQIAIEEIQRVLKKNGKLIVSTPNPRMGHKFIYPSVFEFWNLKKYYENLGFEIVNIDYYGFCPPFWKLLKRLVLSINEAQIKTKKSSSDSSLFATIAYLSSTKPWRYFKPYFLSWSFVFECRVVDNKGAKNKYVEIAKDTENVY